MASTSLHQLSVHIGGFASVDVLGDSEVFGVSKVPPEGFATTATGEFPVMIIYGMAGMAGVVGIGVFIISEKKKSIKLSFTRGKSKTLIFRRNFVSTAVFWIFPLPFRASISRTMTDPMLN